MLASRHGLHATRIATWRKELLEYASDVFENGNPGAEDGERSLPDLQAKGELTMERDCLSSLSPRERGTEAEDRYVTGARTEHCR